MSQYFLQVWRCQDGVLRTSVEPNEKDILDPPLEWGEIDLVSSTPLAFDQRGVLQGKKDCPTYADVLESVMVVMNASGNGSGSYFFQKIFQLVSVATLEAVRTQEAIDSSPMN